VISDTEQQFADCLQQVKTLGEEKEQRQRELEDLGGAPENWWTWWIPRRTAKQARGPC
jgi:hypothetical protein